MEVIAICAGNLTKGFVPEVPVPSGSPTAPPTPSELSKRKRVELYLRLIIVGIVVIIIFQGYIIINAQPQTVIPSGTIIPLNCCGEGQQNATYPFVVSRPSMLHGSFEATYPVTFYLMTASQYANFTSGKPFNYLYGFFDVPLTCPGCLGISQFFLSEGKYYLIFQTVARVNTTLTVTVSFTLTHL